MHSRLWSLLLVPLLLGAGQPIDPRTLAWDSSGGPEIVAGYEAVQGWDGAEIGSTVTELSVPLAARTGTAYAARVRALPVDPVAVQPSEWATLAAEWPDAIPQIVSLSELGRTTAPLPGGAPVVAITYTKAWTTSTTAAGGDVTSGTVAVTTGDVVVALWGNSNFKTGNTLTISSTGGLLGSWTNRFTGAPPNDTNCHVGAWFAVATGTGNITVTVASSESASQPGSLAVVVHTGAHATDPVPSGKVYGGHSATDVGQSITPTASGSALWMIAADWGQTNSYVARTDNTIDNTHNVSGQYTSALIRPTTNPRTDGAAFTIGETDTSGTIAWVALEVQAAAGAGGATALPRRALDGPFYGALRGSVR